MLSKFFSLMLLFRILFDTWPFSVVPLVTHSPVGVAERLRRRTVNPLTRVEWVRLPSPPRWCGHQGARKGARKGASDLRLRYAVLIGNGGELNNTPTFKENYYFNFIW
jgi:hypothetical protein